MGLAQYYAGTLTQHVLPASVFRKIRHLQRRFRANREMRAKARALARFGRFGARELRDQLASQGIRKGGVLLVQSAFGRFHNFEGSALDVLRVLEELVGREGTLMMPAHVRYPPNGPFVFDVRRSPPRTGILCELLRRQPGVIRSLHSTHSVCAVGPLAEALLSDHHKAGLSCGPLSPYARLAEHDGQILGLGVPPGFTTVLHVVEDVAPERFPVQTHLSTPVEFTVKDESGQTFRLGVLRRDRKVLARLKLSRVVRHLTDRSLCVFSVHGVPAFLAHAKPLLEELRTLADRGVHLYA